MRTDRRCSWAFLVPLAAAITSSACSSESNRPESRRSKTLPPDELSQLEQDTGCSWTLTRDPVLGSPSLLQPKGSTPAVLAATDDPQQVAMDFLTKYAKSLGMTDPAAELQFEGQSADGLGMTHVFFTQHAGEVPVWGTRVAVHFDSQGSVAFVTSHYVPGCASLVSTPAISAEDAKTAILSKIDTLVPDATDLVAASADLVIYAMDGSPRLAWNGIVGFHSTTGNALGAIVDAANGAILTTYNAGMTFLQGSGGGVRFHGVPDASDVKEFEVTEKTTASGTSYRMVRPAGGDQTQIEVRGCGMTEYATECDIFQLISSTSLTSGWDDTGDDAGQAVDAAYHLALVDRYYREKHGRASYDGAGSKVIAIIHHSMATDNAASLGNGRFAFGDMDQLKPRLSFVGSLDSVAHEFQHAVTKKTLRLEYSGQSGSIDEALSDIFGMLVEHEFEPGAGNFKGAEQTANGAGPLQAFDDPSSIPTPRGEIPPDHMDKLSSSDDDMGGVHVNSTIVSHAWFLMIAGGKNKTSGVRIVSPLGWENAGKLAYSVVVGGGMSPIATFADFARATIASSKQLPGTDPQELVNTVACAWYATGVLEKEEISEKWNAVCEPEKTCFGGELKCQEGDICSWNGAEKGYCCRKPFTGTVPCVSDEDCKDAGADGICAKGEEDKFWCTTIDSPACEDS